jgi:hypothetical protein
MKKISTSVAIKKIKSKNTLRFHLTPVRKAVLKKIKNKCLQGCGGKEP